VTQNLIQLDPVDYKEISQKYQTWMTGNSKVEPLEPKNPVKNLTMDQYKLVFCKVHKQQLAQPIYKLFTCLFSLPTSFR
jgi:hypothetical protein